MLTVIFRDAVWVCMEESVLLALKVRVLSGFVAEALDEMSVLTLKIRDDVWVPVGDAELEGK